MFIAIWSAGQMKELYFIDPAVSSAEEVKKGMEIHHYRFNRITLDANKCFGKPCIRGLRMPVASILSYLSSGMTIDEILKEWPELERDDIYQALGYAACAMEERVVPLEEASAG